MKSYSENIKLLECDNLLIITGGVKCTCFYLSKGMLVVLGEYDKINEDACLQECCKDLDNYSGGKTYQIE